jgi:lambda family phage portal protein
MNTKPHIKLRHGAGVPILKAGAVAHTAADRGSKQLASWQPFPGSADTDLLLELQPMVSRSRDLIRNNGVAQGAMQTITDNVVGVGLRLVATPDYVQLGWTREQAADWARNVESLWRSWADTTDCDAGRSLTFAGLTTQVYRGSLTNGEGLALPLWLPQAGCKFSTRLQVIESDRLCNPNDRLDNLAMRGGIEVDSYGAPQSYWIRTTHPGDVLNMGAVPGKWEQIPARTSWGRLRVIHLHDKERAGQSRGKPLLTPVMAAFKQLDRYQNAELDAAVLNALIAAIIETPATMEDLSQLLGGPDQVAAFWKDNATQRMKLESGTMVPLLPGEKLSSFNSGRPVAGFEAFVNAMLRYIAAGLNIPYELLLKDFSKTNYSSARAALMEAWRYFKGRRDWLATYWARPVYELWLEEAVNAGLVDAPGFYVNRAAYCRCRWIGSGRGWIDPVKEAQATQLRLATGISTLELECAEQGQDWEEVLHQQAREVALRTELRLPTLTPPSEAPMAPGVAPPEDDEDEDDAPDDDSAAVANQPTTRPQGGFVLSGA